MECQSIGSYVNSNFGSADGFVKNACRELTNNQIADVNVSNKEVGYSSSVRPLTTMVDCEITMAFTLKGLEMSFTTLSVEVSSVIGVKDIKVQQKMWLDGRR